MQTTQEHTNHYHLYLWGYYNQLQNNAPIAEECYTRIFNSKGSLYAYSGYIDFLFATHRYKTIVQIMPRVQTVFKDAIPTQLIFIKTLEKIGNQQEADKRMIALSGINKQNSEIVYNTALAYFRMNDTLKAIDFIDQYLQSIPEKMETFIFYFLKAQLYARIYKKNDALAMVKKSLELNPSFQEGWLFSAIMHELEGNIDDAIVGYQKFLTLVQHDPAVEQQLLSLFLKKNQKGGVTITHEEHLLEQAIALYNEKKYTQSLSVLNNYLEKNPADEQARLFKIELLCALNQGNDALKLVEQWIQHDGKELWLRALHLLYLANIEQTKIIQTLQKIEQRNNTASLYLADIYLKQRNFIQAKKYLHKTLPLTTNESLQAKITYQLGLIYFENQEYETAQKLFTHYESLAQHFAPLGNLMAYYYATKGNNLEKAQKLLHHALINNAHNIHFLDTQALIWYKMRDYKKAAQLLTNLAQQEPNDFFILKHLSKTYYKMGNVPEAIKFMEIACDKTYSHEKNKCLLLLKKWKATIAL